MNPPRALHWRPATSTRTRWLLAVVFCLAADLAFMGDALLPGRVRAPGDVLVARSPFRNDGHGGRVRNRLLADWAVQFRPWHHLVRNAYMEGRVPLWNDLSGTGQPLAANMQSEAFSPYLPLMLAAPDEYADLKQLAQLVIAQIGCLLLAARLGLHPFAACFVAVSFSYCSYIQAFAMHPHAGVAAWAPYVMLTFVSLRERFSRRALAAGGLFIGLALLAGHPETSLMVLLGGFFVALLAGRPGRRRLAGSLSFCVATLAAAVLGVGLAAIQVLPFLEYLGDSFVTSVRSADRGNLPLPGNYLITLLDPWALGTPFLDRPYQGAWNFVEGVLSVNLVAIVLAVGAVLSPRRGRHRYVVPLLLIVLGALMFSHGPAMMSDLVGKIPMMSAAPVRRFGFLALLPISLLSGIGLSRLIEGDGRNRRNILAWSVSCTVLIGIALAWNWRIGASNTSFGVRNGALFAMGALGVFLALSAALPLSRARREILALSLVLLATIFAFRTWRRYVPVVDAVLLSPSCPSVEWLNRNAKDDLVLPTANSLPPELNALVGVRSLRTYDAIGSLRFFLLLSETRSFSAMRTSQKTMSVAPNILDMLGVKWLLTDFDAGQAPRLQYIGTFTRDMGEFRFPWTTGSDASELLMAVDESAPRGNDYAVTVASRHEPKDRLELAGRGGVQAVTGGLGTLSRLNDGLVTKLAGVRLPGRSVQVLRYDPSRSGLEVESRMEFGHGFREGRVYAVSRDGLGTELEEVLRVSPLERIFRRPSALPRFYLSAAPLLASDALEAVKACTSPTFSPQETTVVEAPEEVVAGTSHDAKVRQVVPSLLRPERIEFDLRGLREDRLLVVCDSYATGWTAYVDGEQVPIYPANVSGRAVVVPRGTHHVEMVYEPKGFRWGRWFSLGSLLGLMILAAGRARRL